MDGMTKSLARLLRRYQPNRRCCAKTGTGKPCQMRPATPYADRCRLHGGLSTGPKTAEGRARIAEAQRRRWARWRGLTICDGPKPDKPTA